MSATTMYPPALVAQAVRGALRGHEPTDEQRAVIEAPLEHGLVNAGAGSGKTAVITARLVHLVAAAGVAPDEILGLTFTNKAAEELRSRVAEALQVLDVPAGRQPTITTYHAFASTFLADHGMRHGFEPSSMLMTDAQVSQLLWEAIGSLRFDHLVVRSAYPVRQAADLNDEVANHLVDLDQLIAHDLATAKRLEGRSGFTLRDARSAALRRVDLARALKKYVDLKRVRNRIDFGDQIRVAAELARDREVRAAFHERYRVLLLDEYQDTNIAQAAMLRALVGAEEGQGPIVTAVGDPWQNIYAWRGASIRNILNFPTEFATAGVPARRFPLATNFRSAKHVIDVANRVLEGAVEPGEIATPLVARDGAPEGTIEAHLLEDQEAEARLIRDRIAAYVEEGVPLGEIAVLCRKRRLFSPILRTLREAGIRVEAVGLGGLLEAPEVIDILSLIRATTGPLENVALARILMGPRWRISPFDLAMLARDALDADRARREADPNAERIDYSLSEALERVEQATRLGDEARRRLIRFRERFLRLRASHHLPLDEIVERAIEDLGLRAEVAASTDPNATTIARNLDNLVRLAATFAPVDGQVTPASFLAWVDSVEQTAEALSVAAPTDDDAVKLMTIHAAKGLEFEVVVLCGLAGSGETRAKIFPDTGRQPNPSFNPSFVPIALRGDRETLPSNEDGFVALKQALTERALREEHRLLYVAVTRAKRHLVATAAHWYYPSDSLSESLRTAHGPSDFFEMIAAHPAASSVTRAERPEENPLIHTRDERAANWPPPARRERPGFPEGIAAAVRAARSSAAEDPALFPASAETPPVAPATLSATGLVTYTACPKRFFWSFIRPLPRKSNPKARLGTAIHDWIAQRHDPQLSLLDADEAEAFATPPSGAARKLREAFAQTRFAERVPRAVEHPFAIALDDVVLQGRIDALFDEPDGGIEIVDWKTGRAPAEHDAEDRQMTLYALAVHRLFSVDTAKLRATFVYLGGDEIVERDVPLGPAGSLEADVRASLEAIRAGRFEPRPTSRCGSCDFLHVCPEGQNR